MPNRTVACGVVSVRRPTPGAASLDAARCPCLTAGCGAPTKPGRPWPADSVTGTIRPISVGPSQQALFHNAATWMASDLDGHREPEQARHPRVPGVNSFDSTTRLTYRRIPSRPRYCGLSTRVTTMRVGSARGSSAPLQRK